MTVVLRTAEEELEEILEGAAPLKASSGEIVEEEDYLIQAETRPRRGPTGGKATQETTLLMAGLTPGHFSQNSFFFSSVPEATLDETPLTAAPVPHQGKQGFSGELAARGFIFLIFNFFFARGFTWNKTQFSPTLTLSPGALGGEALCQGLHRLHTLTGEMLANAVNYCQIKILPDFVSKGASYLWSGWC